MIIQSVFLSGGGMLKAIDFPLCSFDIHPNESIHDPLSEGESWLVVTYYYRLTSHSHSRLRGRSRRSFKRATKRGRTMVYCKRRDILIYIREKMRCMNAMIVTYFLLIK